MYSTIEILGSPLETGRELQQLAARGDKATLAGQFAEPTRYFSIMRAIKRWKATWRPADMKSLLDVWIPHEYLQQKSH